MRNYLITALLGCGLLLTPSHATPPSDSTVSDDKLVVHEWGTFTTFSGSDGVFIDFRPLAAEHSDLPDYVRDRGNYSKGIASLLTKNRLWGRVRMETPVTYFYTDRVRTVDVQVDFPQGLLTEFYPPVTSLEPPIDEEKIFGEGESIGRSSLTWKQLNLIPASEFAPNIADANLRDILKKRIPASLVPHAINEQHYAAARRTDSALVHIDDAKSQVSHFEKFLFYRGVGKFDLPIKANFVGDKINVTNTGSQSLRSLIQIQVQNGVIAASKLGQLDANKSLDLGESKLLTVQELSELVQSSLVEEGLYEKEAAAMVATWQQSWFTENGTRVLYMVPTSVTNSLLPLTVTPAPQETVRVLVGRLEIMSPDAEQAMSQAVAQSSQQRAKFMTTINNTRKTTAYPIPDAIRNFGRMAEPALIRVAKIAKDQTVRQEAQLLISQYQQPARQ